MYDLIIIGAGIAGMTASIFASRFGIKHLIFGQDPGGQGNLAHLVENYPGFLKIKGPSLMQKIIAQVKSYGVRIRRERVVGLKIKNQKSKIKNHFLVKTEKGEYQARALILAMGASFRHLNIPGEERFLGRGVSYCTTCLPPGEELVANGCLRKIEEMGIAQKVLTINGTFQNIHQIMSRDYKGEIIKIKTRFFTEPVRLTPDHPVLCTKVKRNYYKRLLIINKPKWKEAGYLTKKDVLLYPIVTKTKEIKKIRFSEILGTEVKKSKAKNDQETHTSLRIADEVPVNEGFLRLAGYYLAEGSIARHGVNFYFNKKEKELIREVKNLIGKLFSLKPYLKTEGGVTRVWIFSKLIRDLFQVLFGKYAPNKKIPHWMLFLPPKKQKEIIKGLYRGDGCLRDKDFCIVTTSRTLAYQIRDILLRFEIIPSIVRRKKAKLNKTPGEIGGRKIRFNYDKYHLVIGGASLRKMSEVLGVHHPELDQRSKVCQHAWIKGNFLYLPLREVKRKSYRGKVYNLAVAENNTYVARNFIVHNCDAPLFRGKIVAVVGGGDSAVSGAVHLANFAKKVFLIHRRDEFRAEKAWVDKLAKYKNIELILSSIVKEVFGKETVEGIKILKTKNQKPKTKNLEVDGLFIEIGQIPSSILAKELGVNLDERDYVLVGPDMATNIHGVFAAGDLAAQRGGVLFRQFVTAASDGARAATSVYHFLTKKEPAPSWGKR